MASLQGLPPLPKGLRGLLESGGEHWKDTGKIIELNNSIQSDLGAERPATVEGHQNGEVQDTERAADTASGPPGKSAEPGMPGVSSKPPSGFSNLESALSFLRHEMVNLRQLDMSLLCQLWTLSENIHEYKQAVHERYSETNSTCSSHSLDTCLESLDAIEEHEYEAEMPSAPPPPPPHNPQQRENVYENGPAPQRHGGINLSHHFDRIRTPEMRPIEIAPIHDPSLSGGVDELYEPMYLEPVPSLYKEIVIPTKRPAPAAHRGSSPSSRASQAEVTPPKTTWKSYPYHNTTYESSC